jgi:hypothetical protein
METKSGFTKMSVLEFKQWIMNVKVARTILRVQEHHTYSPSYIHFKANNHFELQSGMKNYHINHNGWNDIGQHFTIFPDGTILTGRSLEKSPACITGQNANNICIENLGNFDVNGDTMTDIQKSAITNITAILCSKFNLIPDSNSIVYHHWFNLSTGERNNGTKNNKSCPGTNFFGGNKVEHFEANLLPLVRSFTGSHGNTVTPALLKYVVVTSDFLNIRVQPKASSKLVIDRDPVALGAILRVYDISGTWLKISNSQEHWVSGKYTTDVRRAMVSATTLNVRTGPGTNYPKSSSLAKGEIVFTSDENNGWCKIVMTTEWVSKKYLIYN